MKVALTAEGTYPHQFGGVSVWCDQLIRGLPQHEFIVIPLVASGNEAIRWPLPANVTAMATIPLWGRAPSIPLRARLSRGRDDSPLYYQHGGRALPERSGQIGTQPSCRRRCRCGG